MKILPTGSSLLGGLAIALAAFSFTPAAHANVYATDIQINSTLTNSVSVTEGNSFTLTYHLNDNATAGVTIKILSGSSVVSSTSIASPNAGTLLGLNTLSLSAPNSVGTFSVSITAASTGYTNWQQISSDANTNNYAFYVNSMAVDCNTSSPYYGRVIVGNSYEGFGLSPATSNNYYYDGIYKFNADATPADEGNFGYGGYTEDDAGNLSLTNNEMPSGSAVVPWKLRISDDDRIYMLDYSDEGAVSSFDMTATNPFVVVIDEGTEGYLSSVDSTNSYANNPNFSDLSYGIGEFDVTSAGTSNGAVWLCNNDYPNWGIWEYHLTTNGASGFAQSDPADTVGTQAVYAGAGSVMDLVSSGGCSTDSNLDIFCSQARNGAALGDAQSMVYTNWNLGILPPEGSMFTNAETTNVGWADYVASTNDFTWESTSDTVINSRAHPTLVATPHNFGNDNGDGGGIKLVNALNASIKLTGVKASGGNIIITCTSSSPYAPVASQLSLFGSATANGTYSSVAGISVSGSNGVFQITTPMSGSEAFYQVAIPPTGGTELVGTSTTGSFTTALTNNIDYGNAYFCAAFDNVGNLYGASTTTNVWRVWSPPGANTNTTTAVVTLSVRAGGGS